MSTLFSFISQFGERYLLFIKRETYKEGGIRIQLYDSKDGTPYATATTSIQEDLESGEVAIKDWSENEGILDFLVQNKIVKEPHRFVESGYVKIPICELI
jgi:hypothetical protein